MQGVPGSCNVRVGELRHSAHLGTDRVRRTPRVVRRAHRREGLAGAGPNDAEKEEKMERLRERREKEEEKGEEKEKKKEKKRSV